MMVNDESSIMRPSSLSCRVFSNECSLSDPLLCMSLRPSPSPCLLDTHTGTDTRVQSS